MQRLNLNKRAYSVSNTANPRTCHVLNTCPVLPTVSPVLQSKSLLEVLSGRAHGQQRREVDLNPSPYQNLCYGQITGDITHPGFVKLHAMGAGEFGLIPNLPIKPMKFIVDGKTMLELSGPDVVAEFMFHSMVIIKFYRERLTLDTIYFDMVKKWRIVGKFVVDLRDNRTLFVRF